MGKTGTSKGWFVEDILIFVTTAAHVLICPFAKVEESFNLQGCHDLLYNGLDFDRYDHLEFPGVVPRTFLGPLIVSALSWPFVWISGRARMEKFASQIIARCVLGFLTSMSLVKFRRSIRDRFGRTTALWHAIITISQFHLMFYSSRTLPNTFALVAVLNALHFWLEDKQFSFILTSAIAIVVFRGELAIFLGAILLMDIAVGRIKMLNLIPYCMISLIVSLALTIPLDTFMWQKSDYYWPEGQVLYYNVILNKSSNWGVMPWGWYFYSAIPRALGSSLLFVGLGLWADRRTLVFVLPCVVFVSLYSFLPHKELRFVIYVVPLLNVAAAEACKKMWVNRYKPSTLWWRKIAALAAVFHILANLIFTSLLINISSKNYPGGEALATFHRANANRSDLHVHIDVFAAQTGVSRFAQLNNDFTYNKTEGLSSQDLIDGPFTHLIMEHDEMKISELQPHFKVTHQVEAFAGVELDYEKLPPLVLKSKIAIALLERL